MRFALAVLMLALLTPFLRGATNHVVTGTIVFEDELGARRPVREGSILFWLGGRGGERFEAPVKDGRFVLDLPHADGRLDVGPITADGVASWAIPAWDNGQVPVDAELVARRVKPAFARFVDATTGAELDDGFVYRPAIAPHEDDRAIAKLAAPFEIPLFAERKSDPQRSWIGLREYAVTPEGYVRQRVWLDPSEGGTRTFEFDRAATLLLWLPIAGIGTGHRVLITREGSNDPWPCGPVPPVCGTTHLRLLAVRDLPAGAWIVRIVAAGTDIDTFPTVRVDLEAGVTREVRYRDLEWKGEDSKRARVELRGTLRIPNDVDPNSIVLRFEPGPDHEFGTHGILDIPNSALVRDRDDPRLLHWYGGVVSEGAWIASVPELHWSRTFDLVRGHAPIVLTTVPDADQNVAAVEPRTIARFRVVDGPTGVALDPSDVIARANSNATECAWSASEAAWSTTTNHRSVKVELERRSEPSKSHTLEFDASTEIATLELWPPMSIEVRAYDGDARIGAPEIESECAPRIESIGHDGRAPFPRGTLVTRAGENVYRDVVTRPGRYRVSLASAMRYSACAPIEVEVNVGEPPPVAVFRLQRAKR